MAAPDKCCVAECGRNAAASVSRDDVPGPLRLCATHTEQFRQSSEGWGIAWAKGDPAPSSVTAPSGDVLWAYRPGGGSGPEPVTATEPPERRGGLSRVAASAAGWIEARRHPPK